MLVYSINFDFTICTSIQGIAHYLFNPAVVTHRQIEDSSINTSFYSLTGANFEEDVLVESILLEVSHYLYYCPCSACSTVMSSDTFCIIIYVILQYVPASQIPSLY